MKRPLAYITSAWTGNEFIDTEKAITYSRAVYESGYSPICPNLYMPLFIDNNIPDEHESTITMSKDLLKRSRVLIVCGRKVDETVKTDIATASRLGITATTLDGILIITKHGQVKADD